MSDELPEWFTKWLANERSLISSQVAMGTTFKRPVTRITLPSTAGVGDARMVIGQPLPPPLDTYLFFNLNTAIDGIIWYDGTTIDDSNYHFLVQVAVLGTTQYIFLGTVQSGAIVEYDAVNNFPAGTVWNYDGAGAISTFINSGTLFLNALSELTEQILITREAVAKRLTASIENTAGFATAGTTGVGTFANMPGPFQITSFVKQYDESAVKIEFASGFINDAANIVGDFGVNIDGTDYLLFSKPNNTANHDFGSGSLIIGGGIIAAGDYPVDGRWRKGAGSAAGLLRLVVSNYHSMTITEVSE